VGQTLYTSLGSRSVVAFPSPTADCNVIIRVVLCAAPNILSCLFALVPVFLCAFGADEKLVHMVL
jgi:hypothetical protein